MRRRLQRRAQLVRARTRAKNEIHATLMRKLVGRPPFTDLFGRKGRRWLAELELPAEKRESVDAAARISWPVKRAGSAAGRSPKVLLFGLLTDTVEEVRRSEEVRPGRT